MRSGNLDWLMSKLDGVTKWKDFGVQLKVPYCECSKIEQDYSNCSDRLRETVAWWLTKTTDPNSVNLINALNKISEKKLAHDIQQEICQGNVTITCMLSIHDFQCLCHTASPAGQHVTEPTRSSQSATYVQTGPQYTAGMASSKSGSLYHSDAESRKDGAAVRCVISLRRETKRV